MPEEEKKTSPEGRSPPQDLEVGPHSGPYLLVYSKTRMRNIQLLRLCIQCLFLKLSKWTENNLQEFVHRFVGNNLVQISKVKRGE